jgi:hypothetical protein
MRFTVILVGLLMALVVVAGGCGGSSGTGSSGASDSSAGSSEGPAVNEEATGGSEEEEAVEKPSPEKAAFIKKGDVICTKVPQNYEKALKALEKENGGKKPSTAESNTKAAVPPLYTAAEELEGLTPPSGEEEQLEAMVAALNAAAKGVEEEPKSELSGPKSPFAEFQKLTQEYGFKVCSQL